jgi:hypothetical protein
MNPPDHLHALMKLGLFRSVEIISSFAPRATTRNIITRARALIELWKYPEAFRVLESIEKSQRSEDEMNEIPPELCHQDFSHF